MPRLRDRARRHLLGRPGAVGIAPRTRQTLEAQYRPDHGWDVAPADHSRVHVDFPAGYGVDLDPGDPGWVQAAQPVDATARLYLHSLYYLPLLDSRGAAGAAEALLRGYDAFCRTPAFAELIPGNPSWDHATAMRLEALCLLAARDEGRAWVLGSDLFETDLAWASDPENIRLNNHGLMLVRAVLTAARVLRDRRDDRAGSAESVAVEALRRILASVFGDDGYCDENSPHYSDLYVQLLASVRDHHAPALARAGALDLVTGTLEAARATTAVQVYPDGTFVPRGDTEYRPSGYVPPRGTFCSERVGLWVHHGPSLYVMATSGFASATHKHRDDLQVLVRYQGQDFLVDGGYAGYDRRDRRVTALRRQLAHSCLAFPELDEPSHDLFVRTRDQGWAGVTATDGTGRPTVTLTKGLEGHFSGRRRLEVADEHALRLTDSWASWGWRGFQRFLVPQEAEIEVGDATIEVMAGGKRLVLDYGTPVAVSVVSAEQERPYRGWRGMEPGVLVPCHCVEVVPRDPGRSGLEVDLLFGDAEPVPEAG